MFCPIYHFSPLISCPPMDAINIEKYQAMKKYNFYSRFISSLIQCSLLVVMFGLFLSSPLWLPTLHSSIKLFKQSLPKIITIVHGPKCLFIVLNLIIIFFMGKSRLTSSCPNRDIYEEYVAHAQRLKGVPNSKEKFNEGALLSALVEVKKEEEDDKEVEEERESEDKEEEEEREEGGLSNEELNKRVEDFISRVNMQRRLEDKRLVCWVEK